MNEQNILTKRCAIYTRKSSEDGLEKEFNSLEAQFDSCSSYIQSQSSLGWQLIDRHYDDGGYSGGNTHRPALQQLLRDIGDGLVDVVVVYKLDRISRSLRDFMDLSRIFEDHNVSLVSVTQKFDTSTSMGRMMLNMLMTFAQFEREMTADRIRDKMEATRKKGMWTGGVIPYGYKTVDRKLVVEPEQAAEVLYAYEQYLDNRSFLETSRVMTEKYGTRKDGSKWTVMNLRCLLQQAIPAGKIRDSKTGELYDGQHEAIVPLDLWMKVQDIITKKKTGLQTNRTASGAPLKGLLRCGYCDGAMVPSFCINGKKRYHYYRCVKSHKHLTEDCQLKMIPADMIEKEVFRIVGEVVEDEFFLQSIVVDCGVSIGEARKFMSELVQRLGKMTQHEKQRFAQQFIRTVTARRDGVEIAIRADGFRNLMKKGKEQ